MFSISEQFPTIGILKILFPIFFTSSSTIATGHLFISGLLKISFSINFPALPAPTTSTLDASDDLFILIWAKFLLTHL